VRIAIVKPSALGDIVHALPVLSALRGAYPDSHIAWVVNQSFEGLLTGHPDLNETIPFDRAGARGIFTAPRYAARFAQRLRQHEYDLVVDLQGLLRTGLMTAAMRAKRKVGFADAREGARFAYGETVSPPAGIHAVDRNWAVAAYLGAGAQPKRFVVPVDPAEHTAVRKEFHDLPRPWFAVAVGAKWVTKRWPPGHFGELLARAQREFGGTAIFVGVKDDAALAAEAMSHLPAASVDLCGKTSVPKLTALLSLADVMVANDTGPLHLAAALNVPCVAPYTCTKVSRHGPYTSLAGGVETTVACAGSYLKSCPNGTVCFSDLTADRLWPALAGVLSQWQRRSRSA
jgi:lipopolysaccharide heptosyltransferase I